MRHDLQHSRQYLWAGKPKMASTKRDYHYQKHAMRRQNKRGRLHRSDI